MASFVEQAPPERRGLKLFLSMKRNPLSFFAKLMNEAGAFAWMNINGHPTVMLNDATGIEHVLQGHNANYYKGHFQRRMSPLFGESILLQEGASWKKHRQHAAPVFSHGNFEDIVHQTIHAVEAMFQRWDADIAQGKLIDVTLEMTRFTLDAFLRALFHETRSDVASEMRSSLGVMLRDAENRVWSCLNLPYFVVRHLPKYSKAKRFMKRIVTEIIEARRANKAYPEDLLSRFVEGFGRSGKEQKALYDEVLAYVLAGHETTAHGLAWALYTLSLYPEVHGKVKGEVASVLGYTLPTMESLMDLTYTRQVLDEVFRLYPPVWTMSREALADDKIPLDDGSFLEVSAGTSIMMCHYAVHRREIYWPNPEAFDPTRFDPEAVRARPKFAWFPFGGGPRLCLGFRFAQVESLIALSMITQRYQFSLVSGQQVRPEPIITLRPADCILFKMRKRTDFVCVPDGIEGQAAEAISDAAVGALGQEQAASCPFHFDSKKRSSKKIKAKEQIAS